MKRLLILGAGQYGMVAREIAETMGYFDEISFLDDNSSYAVGKLDEINHFEYEYAFVAIGNSQVREYWLDKIPEAKRVTLVHPQAVVMKTANIGKGSIIEAGAVVSYNASIGKGTIVMANSVVGHDAIVADYCQLKYGCIIPERCTVQGYIKVDCNEVYNLEKDKENRHLQKIDEINKAFIKEEIEKNGVEPSFF